MPLPKNPEAQRTKAIRKLADRAKSVLLLTGTPLENRINEMRNLIGFLQPELARSLNAIDYIAGPELFRQSMLDDNPEAYWTMDSIMNYFVIQDGYIYYKDNLEIQGDYLYFIDYANDTRGGGWEQGIDTVRERATLDSEYYLSNEGIVFYYEVGAVSLSVNGFYRVVIPYSEFKMKINLQFLTQ